MVAENDFKSGDKVRVVQGNSGSLPDGSEWEVWASYVDEYGKQYVSLKDHPTNQQSAGPLENGWDIERFVLVESIARPILEERKVGKVQMDLFDQGFPNAVNEVAKVMTWAAENKGYKPHDWKGLPNAETEFSAAASRHRVKGFIQKGEGVAAIDRTDEESNIVHLAHAAFNILAELELVLTGKIK